jgi:hypothetical protein
MSTHKEKRGGQGMTFPGFRACFGERNSSFYDTLGGGRENRDSIGSPLLGDGGRQTSVSVFLRLSSLLQFKVLSMPLCPTLGYHVLSPNSRHRSTIQRVKVSVDM